MVEMINAELQEIIDKPPQMPPGIKVNFDKALEMADDEEHKQRIMATIQDTTFRAKIDEANELLAELKELLSDVAYLEQHERVLKAINEKWQKT